MRNTCAVLVALLLPLPTILAAQGDVQGRVLDPAGAPVPSALVTLGDDVVSVDSAGVFRMAGLARGSHQLRVTAPGHRATTRSIEVPLPAPLVIVLRRDPIALDAITVTGTLRRTSASDSPVKVEVVPTEVLQRNATNNLTESIRYVNGLYTQIDCGVCYTNNIRINGMEGPYTAVLIDGMPIMSALSSVYGLNGLNPAMIEQVEIVKGPASTLYGSEAMAGVINVITKDPRFAPRWSVDVRATSHTEGNLDFALATEPGDISGLVSGNLSYNQRFVDDNGDGFSDFPLNRRGVVFAKLDHSPDGIQRAGLSARYQYEDRFGGVEAWTPADRGSDRVYGEYVLTNRAELIGSWRPGPIRFEGSYTWHDQESYYGDEEYFATQHVGFLNALLTRRWGSHDVLVGATARFESYDDNTPATSEPDRRWVPGLFVQDEVELGEWGTLLGGLRADHYGEHGLVFSPRLAVKWEPLDDTAIRLNAGTGFRAVHLFTEDHAALTGSREVVIVSELRPERSRSVTLNVNQVVELGPSPMMIDLDLFHTRFSNRIAADYDVDPSLIVYDNLSGHAVSRGVALSLNQNVDFDRFLYTAGITLQDVYIQNDTRESEFFAPSVRGVLGATYNARSLPLTLDYTGSITGPMRLPTYDPPFERPDRSPTWSEHNLQATWRIGDGGAVYLGVRNMFDYVQPSALVHPRDPFSDDFDTAYVYGPLRGRSWVLGFRYGGAR